MQLQVLRLLHIKTFTYAMGAIKVLIGNEKTDSLTVPLDRDLTSYGIQHSISWLATFAETSS